MEGAEREREEAQLVEFLRLYLAHQEAGEVEETAAYRRRFPAIADRITAEIDEIRACGELPEVSDRDGDWAMPPWPPGGPVRLPFSWGRLHVESEIGRGGQAVVYRARDEVLGDVALKVLELRRVDLATGLARFRREAAAASRLNDPGICAVHGAGVSAGHPFIVMDLVHGRPLSDVIAASRLPDREGIAESVAFFESVARTLHRAHEAGVIHRDVKPANLMVADDGSHVLLDFGLASGLSSGESVLTRSGELLGTPPYMSPEQILRQPSRVDRRTDVYSLAVALFEVLTLRRPFEEPTDSALYHAITVKAPPSPAAHNPAVGRDLALVITTAMNKDPEERYRTALDLADDLRRARAAERIVARAPGPWQLLVRWLRRSPGYAAAIIVLALALAVALAFTTWQWIRARDAGRRNQVLADATAIRGLLDQYDDVLERLPEEPEAGRAWLTTARRLAPTSPTTDSPLRGDLRRLLDPWWRGTIAEEMSRLVEVIPDLGVRCAFWSEAESALVDGYRSEWDAVCREMADRTLNPRYRGLRIEPQRGLIPLRRHPDTGLYEFLAVNPFTDVEHDRQAALAGRPTARSVVLILIPGGVVTMGSPPGEAAERLRESERQHERELSAYFIGRYEVTQALWGAEMKSNPATGRPGGPWGVEVSLEHPIENVTWFQATAFAARLDLRLPTEAEWEHAARAGARTAYWCGDDVESLEGVANLPDQSFAGSVVSRSTGELVPVSWDDRFPVHAPVGSFRPNPFGLHDVHGNVAEWCSDVYVAEYHDEAVRADPPDSSRRLFRGGSWFLSAADARCAARERQQPSARHPMIGLRLARSVRP